MSSNSDDRTLERRLAAVERAVDGSEQAAPDATAAENESLERRLADLEQRVDELDAALQAIRGFLGGVDAVNEAVESRADAAIAAVDRLEHRLDETDVESPQQQDESGQRRSPGDHRQSVRARADTGGRSDDEGEDEHDRTLRDRLSEQW